jgi:hypothetical protein
MEKGIGAAFRAIKLQKRGKYLNEQMPAALKP